MSLPLESPASPPAGLPQGGAVGVAPAVVRPMVGPIAGPIAAAAVAGSPGWPLGTLRQPADFQRVLGTAPRARSQHFSVHHAPGRPAPPAKAAQRALAAELSTGDARSCPPPVDDLPAGRLPGRWFGLVVPKRHAKRAVTRTLIKRQMRAVMHQHADHLMAGLWVLRLRAPFDKARFVSAASDALRRAVRDELATLVQKALAARPVTRGAAHA